MKKYHLFILIFCFLLNSCKSDDNSSATESNFYFITAKIDNMNWDANNFSATYSNKIVSIEAQSLNGSRIEISAQGVSSIGTYDLGNVSIGTYQDGNRDNETYTTAGTLGTGSITFNTLDSTRIEGSFSFTGENGLGNAKNITSGSFEINLTN